MHLMDSGRGFYEGGSVAFSQTYSSSSSRQKAALVVPYSYNHNQESVISHQQTELKMDCLGGDNDMEEGKQFNIIGGGGGGGESSGEVMEVIEREHMFDKVVTPSDVGKLNRLVIPKQQAEKYFPLDSSTNEKGLLLNFEDRNGKQWRFRYSYWKSSQSYVMTKGWSRFVKEKKLDAGDVVSFQRGVAEFAKDRLFIDWRRRRPEPPLYAHELPPPVPPFSLSTTHFPLRPWNNEHHHNYPVISPHHHHHAHRFNTYGPYSSTYGNNNNNSPGAGSIVYLKSSGGGGGGGVGLMQLQRGGVEGGMAMAIPPSMVYESVPVVQGKAVAKKLRLFGVNMECPITENNEHEILSSTTIPHFPTHLPNSSNPSLSLPPYFAHHPQTLFHQTLNHHHNKGKSSMSLDLGI